MLICLNATFIFFFPPTLFQTLNIQWGFWTSGSKTQAGTSFKDAVLHLRFLWSTWSLIKTSEFSTTCLAGADSSRARPREAATWCRQRRKRQEGRKAQSPDSMWAAHGEGMCALFFCFPAALGKQLLCVAYYTRAGTGPRVQSLLRPVERHRDSYLFPDFTCEEHVGLLFVCRMHKDAFCCLDLSAAAIRLVSVCVCVSEILPNGSEPSTETMWHLHENLQLCWPKTALPDCLLVCLFVKLAIKESKPLLLFLSGWWVKQRRKNFHLNLSRCFYV